MRSRITQRNKSTQRVAQEDGRVELQRCDDGFEISHVVLNFVRGWFKPGAISVAA